MSVKYGGEVFKFILFIFLGYCPSVLFAKDFVSEYERDYSLRSIGHLNVTNFKGNITLQGWALDKIRVKLKKRVTAETPKEAKELFDWVDYRYSNSSNNIEISSQYGSSQSIGQRLQEKEHPRVHMDMMIYAPSHLKLTAWAIDGKVTLKSWTSESEVRTNDGHIRVEGIKAESISVLCKSCLAQLKNVRASVRCIGGTGGLELNTVSGKEIYVQTDSGAVKLRHVKGDQLYISGSGPIDGQFLNGHVAFQAGNASVGLKEVSGSLSGSVKTGDIKATVRDWQFEDKAILESTKGNISLTLPAKFSAEVDIWSMQGAASMDFPLEKLQTSASFGPEPANHIVGRVNDGGELLKVLATLGDISILREKP